MPDFYRSQATQYWALADQAETIEMRVALLEMAERLDKLAAGF